MAAPPPSAHNPFITTVVKTLQPLIASHSVWDYLPTGQLSLVEVRSELLLKALHQPELKLCLNAILTIKPRTTDSPNDHQRLATYLITLLNKSRKALPKPEDILLIIKLSALLVPLLKSRQLIFLANRVPSFLLPANIVTILKDLAPVMGYFTLQTRQNLVACFINTANSKMPSTHLVAFIQTMTPLCRLLTEHDAKKTATHLAKLAMAKNALDSYQIAPVLTDLARVLEYLTHEITTNLVNFAVTWLLELLPAKDHDTEDEGKAHPNLDPQAIFARFNINSINALPDAMKKAIKIMVALIPYYKPDTEPLNLLILSYAQQIAPHSNRLKLLEDLTPAQAQFTMQMRQRALALVDHPLIIGGQGYDFPNVEDLLKTIAAIWHVLPAQHHSALTDHLKTKITNQMTTPLNLKEDIAWTIPTMTFVLAHSNSSDQTQLAQTIFTHVPKALQNAFSNNKLVFLHLLVLIWRHLTLEKATKTPKLIFDHIPELLQCLEPQKLALFAAMQDQKPWLPASVRAQLAHCSADFILNQMPPTPPMAISDAMALLPLAQDLNADDVPSFVEGAQYFTYK